MDNSEIERLIASIALSDRKAFDRLYAQAAPKLFGVVMRILKDRAQAEDALQEVFIKVWQRAASYRSTSQSPMAWLVAIARNHAIDVIRAGKGPHEDIEDQQALQSPEPDPERIALASGERSRIEACLEQLDANRAEAVVSAYVEGYSYQELADRYAVPINTMRTWLRRSLISLRECLDDGQTA